MQESGCCPQHLRSMYVGISLQLLQTHQVGLSVTWGPNGGAFADVISKRSNIMLGSRVRQSCSS